MGYEAGREEMSYKVIERFYEHIDNGGISIDFGYYLDDDIKTPSVKMTTHYHGHAWMTTELRGGELTPNVLTNIGRCFINFASTLPFAEEEE